MYKTELDWVTAYKNVENQLEEKDNRIAELEKENAELKDYRLNTMAKEQTEMSKYALNLEHKLSWYDDQLTKAKEILEEVCNSIPSSVAEYIKEPLEKAEQFLKDEPQSKWVNPARTTNDNQIKLSEVEK